ncbi:hypothetical protein [Humibacillus xanthopallidus]|uniref:Uncharacterized protein n=1 Tax=Humibacillus xanthopallidus TaxID=412689 RepID=A0A543I0J1_9MICO|nr:hypothetical protein [Humibacillus xanthopallidus]TQM64117.1 hypothetical protein FBY41_0477 [Humibacillus xanthopallidus]
MTTPGPAPVGRPTDPPPYAWLDDPAQPFGPVGVGTTLTMGSFVTGLGLLGVGYGIFGGADARVARLVVGVAFVVLGAVILRMGLARQAWRARNPGIDPLEAAVTSGANVGSALGDDSATGRIGRWILAGVCAAVVLVCVLALTRIGSGQSEGGVGAIVLVVLLGALAGTVGVLTLRRAK